MNAITEEKQMEGGPLIISWVDISLYIYITSIQTIMKKRISHMNPPMYYWVVELCKIFMALQVILT